MSELLTTHEVAEYLRIKERKVYELVREGRIPCSRVTGKWLFPKPLVDLWLAQSTELPEGLGGGSGAVTLAAPPVIAGSHDPLLEWALRQSRSDLAMLPGGSLDGLARLARRQASAAGMHVLDDESDAYNTPLLARTLAGRPVVAIEWAWRRQGLVVASGNPLGLETIADLAAKKARVAGRQLEAGSHILLLHLLGRAGLGLEDLDLSAGSAASENDLALAVLEGRADGGLAVEAAARQHRLDFVPLHRERYDLALYRRDYFEPPFQALLEFARGAEFRQRAEELGGYDVSGLGRVTYNA